MIDLLTGMQINFCVSLKMGMDKCQNTIYRIFKMARINTCGRGVGWERYTAVPSACLRRIPVFRIRLLSCLVIRLCLRGCHHGWCGVF